jgi:hypothetical protein
MRGSLLLLGCLAVAGNAWAQVPASPPAAATPGPGAPADQTTAPPPPNNWTAQGSAELQALDKASARNATLTVKVGQSVQYGSLTIQVVACVVRPPDQPGDAAAFLIVTDQHADQPGFRGWMLRSNPSLAMLQHPVYDLRVLGCRP